MIDINQEMAMLMREADNSMHFLNDFFSFDNNSILKLSPVKYEKVNGLDYAKSALDKFIKHMKDYKHEGRALFFKVYTYRGIVELLLSLNTASDNHIFSRKEVYLNRALYYFKEAQQLLILDKNSPKSISNIREAQLNYFLSYSYESLNQKELADSYFRQARAIMSQHQSFLQEVNSSVMSNKK